MSEPLILRTERFKSEGGQIVLEHTDDNIVTMRVFSPPDRELVAVRLHETARLDLADHLQLIWVPTG